MSWYSRGYENIPKQGGGKTFFNRLALPYGGTKDIVFVDDDPFRIWEHNPQVGSEWRNWCTCKGQGCKACEAGEKKYFVGYYTVVDCSKWDDSKGVSHQFELSFLCAKTGSLAQIAGELAVANDPEVGRNGLKGSMYRLSRSTKEANQKAPRIGDALAFMRVGDMDKLFGLAMFKGQPLSEMFDEAEADEEKMALLEKRFIVKKYGENGKLVRTLPIFNYEEILKPLADKEVAALVGQGPSESGGDDFDYTKGNASNGGGFSQADEDIPF